MSNQTNTNNTDPTASLSTQLDLINAINQTLLNNDEIIGRINTQLNNQTQILSDMNNSFVNINKNLTDINTELDKTLSSLKEISDISFVFISSEILSDIHSEMEKIVGVTETLSSELNNNSKHTSDFHKSLLDRQQKIANSESNLLDDSLENSEEFLRLLRQMQSISESQRNAEEESLNCLDRWRLNQIDFIKGLAAFGKTLFSGAINAAKIAKEFIVGSFNTLKSIMKMTVGIPFEIASIGASVGNSLRQKLVVDLGQAYEDLKEKFDMSSYIGQNITSMKKAAVSAMIQFEKPNSEFVKLFGYGTDGMKNYMASYAELVDSLGAFGEIYAGEIRKAEQAGLFFTKARKYAGYAAEDFKYFATDAAASVTSLTKRINEAINASERISEEYNIDFKQLSKNFMTLRKDISLFGHISDESLNRTAAVMTKMGIEMKEASAVFNKFSTFEDASNAAAILGQTFGMNLNAMDMIRAEKPDEIFSMFRNAMLDTGRTFDELSRHEKNIMVQQTGMSAEALRAMMNYTAAGLTFEEARKEMEQNSPEQKQIRTLNELKSSIKEIKKILNGKSFWDSLTSGLFTRLSYHKETKDTLMKLSEGYQKLYESAMNMDPNTLTKLIRPIRYVINTMRRIFESKKFKASVKEVLRGFGSLLSYAFNIRDPEKDYAKVKTKLKRIDLKSPDENTKYRVLNLIKQLEAKTKKKGVLLKIDEESEGDEYSKYEAAAKKKKITLTAYLLSLAKHNRKDSDKMLETLDREDSRGRHLVEAKEHFSKAFDLQSENVSILGNITKKVLKAFIVGSMTGITGLLKSLNDKLSNTKIDKSASMLSVLADISEDEAAELMDNFTTAVSDTFAKGGALGGIGLFITSQMFTLFKEIGYFFADVLWVAIKGVFGGEVKVSDANTASSATIIASQSDVAKSTQSLSKGFRTSLKPEIKSSGNFELPDDYFSAANLTRGAVTGGVSFMKDYLTQTYKYAKSSDKNEYTAALKSNIKIGPTSEHILTTALAAIDRVKQAQGADQYSSDLQQLIDSIDAKASSERFFKRMKNEDKSVDFTYGEYELFKSIIKRMATEDAAAAKKTKSNDIVGNAPALRLFDSQGKNIDIHSMSGMNNDGVFASISSDYGDIAENSVAIDSLIRQKFAGSQFNEKSNRKKAEELCRRIIDTIDSQDNSEHEIKVDIMQALNLKDIPMLQELLVSYGKGIFRYMGDPRFNQGNYHPDMRHAKNPTGSQSDYVPSLKYNT